ncbi:hypothetical protein BCEP4_510007 [Burkholderia cepacia]|nr:hypothetical protein BCEP4_510007 [Burkholderia cepacia]
MPAIGGSLQQRQLSRHACATCLIAFLYRQVLPVRGLCIAVVLSIFPRPIDAKHIR